MFWSYVTLYASNSWLASLGNESDFKQIVNLRANRKPFRHKKYLMVRILNERNNIQCIQSTLSKSIYNICELSYIRRGVGHIIPFEYIYTLNTFPTRLCRVISPWFVIIVIHPWLFVSSFLFVTLWFCMFAIFSNLAFFNFFLWIFFVFLLFLHASRREIF